MKTAIILGTRAELIKSFPLIKRLDSRNNSITFIGTGQHNLDNLCKKFGIKTPDYYLSEPVEESSRFNGSIFSAIMWSLSNIFKLRKVIDKDTDYVLFHGDTMSTALAAIGTSFPFYNFKKFDKVHVEAGLRSGNIFEPFPEELSRILVDFLSDINIAVSKDAADNISKLRYLGKEIVPLGNTIQDSLREMLNQKRDSKKEYGIVTIHRHENLSNKERMEKIITILEKSGLNLIFPMHDNTRNALEEYGLLEKIENNSNIEIRDLIDYPEFVNLMSESKILFTDGGSIQEESVILGIPCVIFRNKTERKEELKEEINFLSNFREEETLEFVKKATSGEISKKRLNNQEEVSVSERIIDYLENRL